MRKKQKQSKKEKQQDAKVLANTKVGIAGKEKDLKRLTRLELLELLYEQSREIDRLREALEAARAESQNRHMLIAESGSIAEAALKLNGVFEAAQAAADQYLLNVKRISGVKDETGNY